MRTTLLALLCFAAGCDQFVDDIAVFPDLGPDLTVAGDMSRAVDSATAPQPDLTIVATPDMTSAADLAGGLNCTKNCPPCALDQLCIGAIQDAPYETTCAHRCSTQSDCDATESCVALFGEQGAVCVKTGWPRICPGPADAGAFTCAAMAPACLDVNTLTRPYDDFTNGACGVEHDHCEHGCAPASNNMPAQCNP